MKITVKPSMGEMRRKFGNININGFLSKKIKEYAFLIERESKKVTPVDTGRLRASIGVTLRPMGATIQPDTHYAYWVHQGTRYVDARPYMFWGAETASQGFEEKMAKELDAEIQKEIQ